MMNWGICFKSVILNFIWIRITTLCVNMPRIHYVDYFPSTKMITFDVHHFFSFHHCKSDVSLVQNSLTQRLPY